LIGLALIAAAVLLVREQGEPEVLAGQASVIDGDTLRVAGQKVRLQGLAAPEISEAGGHKATAALIQIVKGQRVSCELDGTKSHDRVVGICYVEGRDVAAELVKHGLARVQRRPIQGVRNAEWPATSSAVLLCSLRPSRLPHRVEGS
jgi:endonuclease YncB( thermonuclease family)